MSERFSPNEPSEAKEPTQEAKSISPEARARMQGGPEATKPGDLNHPMEGAGLGEVQYDAQGNPVTTEMQEKHKGIENQVEKEADTVRAGASDSGQTPTSPSDQPIDTSTPDPATTDDTKGPPKPGSGPPADNPPPDPPPVSKEDQATLDWMKKERERQETEVKDDLKKWDERPKPVYYRGPDDPPLNAPHFERLPPDKINDAPRPMTETPVPNRGRRSMQGNTNDA